ncbi:MAG: hypothetical protein QNL01_03140 [Akkermansiaceae bacterium]|jgi:hypothetical protein|tara:strand:- start:1029 stop:1490 length:462 start_codon:yes stop_codon:yes gene_type:complete
MTDTQKEEVTPDQLMKHFQGSSLKSIIIFTLIVHAVLLAGSSFPYLYKTVVGEDNSKMSEKERTEAAMREATVALREIAEEHGLKPQDLSSQLAGGAPKAPKATTPDSDAKGTQDDPGTEAEDPKSSIEKELDKKATGPTVPNPEDDEEDLFK